MDIQATLVEFIESNLAVDREQAKIAADEPLFGGLLDSLDMLRLVVLIEERFPIQVKDEDLVPENFQTVQTIAAYIGRKLGAGV